MYECMTLYIVNKKKKKSIIKKKKKKKKIFGGDDCHVDVWLIVPLSNKGPNHADI